MKAAFIRTGLSIWSGDIVFFGGSLFGYCPRHCVFDKKTGEYKSIDLKPLAPFKEEYYDIARPNYKEREFSKLAEYDGIAVNVRQLDANLFTINLLKVAERKLYVANFALTTNAITSQDKFLQKVELSSERLLLIMGDSKQRQLGSISITGVALASFMKPQFETNPDTWYKDDLPMLDALKNPPQTDDLKPGLNCDIYRGAWSVMPDIAKLPLHSSIETKSFATTKSDWPENVIFSFEGYRKIDKEGQYDFMTMQPGGFAMHMDEDPIVFKPAVQWIASKYLFYSAILKPGLHKVRLELFTEEPWKQLEAHIKGPDDNNFKSVEGMVFHIQQGKRLE